MADERDRFELCSIGSDLTQHISCSPLCHTLLVKLSKHCQVCSSRDVTAISALQVVVFEFLTASGGKSVTVTKTMKAKSVKSTSASADVFPQTLPQCYLYSLRQESSTCLYSSVIVIQQHSHLCRHCKQLSLCFSPLYLSDHCASSCRWDQAQ